jgi:hypothetical protein
VASEIDQERYFTYDKAELLSIMRAFKAMDEVGQAEARRESGALAEYATQQIRASAVGPQQQRIAQGIKVSQKSKIGEFGIGFASQKFSGGATTQLNINGQAGGRGILAGVEFGSKRFSRFGERTPRYGQRGNVGRFIWPTMRRIQPEIIRKWEIAFEKVIKEWT